MICCKNIVDIAYLDFFFFLPTTFTHYHKSKIRHNCDNYGIFPLGSNLVSMRERGERERVHAKSNGASQRALCNILLSKVPEHGYLFFG